MEIACDEKKKGELNN